MPAATANRFFRGSGDVFLTVLLVIVSVVQKHGLTPYHRGFFQNDQSLMYPYKNSTVPFSMLYLVGVSVTAYVVILTEATWLRISLSRLRTPLSIGEEKEAVVVVWLRRLGGILLLHFYGLCITHITCNLLKFALGRLRPHFMDVCKPNYQLLGTRRAPCFGPYIEEDICTGNKDLISEARQSFPSGHAAVSLYCALFLVLYLERRMTWDKVLLVKPSIQAAAVCIAMYVSCTRVSDHKHHMSDVLAGAILGGLVAVLMVISVFLL